MDMTKTLSPEDIRPGDYIVPMQIISERTPAPWDPPESWEARPVLRVMTLPHKPPTPAQVVDVCLPVVLIRSARGRHRTIDVRRYRLGRVSTEFGARVFAQLDADRREREAQKQADAQKATREGADS